MFQSNFLGFMIDYRPTFPFLMSKKKLEAHLPPFLLKCSNCDSLIYFRHIETDDKEELTQ